MRTDLHRYVQTCDACQRMKAPEANLTSLYIPQTSLFEVFSVAFAGLFPITKRRNRFLLVYVEHLTEWPIVKATGRVTMKLVVSVLKTEVILSFGAPKTILSDNAACFTAQAVQRLMKSIGTEWRIVLAYATMSNGRAERMVKTMKKAIGRVVWRLGF